MDYLIVLIPVLVNIAFITLLERKILGFSQLRLGPNKVALGGIFQPFADAVKLFSKSWSIIEVRRKALFLFSPGATLFFIFFLWSVSRFSSRRICYGFSLIVIITIIRFGVYPLMVAGWSSGRHYAIIGGMRGVAQTISYEIRFALVVLILASYCGRVQIRAILRDNLYIPLLLILPLGLGVWLISSLAETNRTPFDFAEGESELVSGFNIEYGSGRFVLLFMAEYGRILFLSYITVTLFTLNYSMVIKGGIVGLRVSLWIWARATLPRYRYDLLINLAWKRILPFVLSPYT